MNYHHYRTNNIGSTLNSRFKISAEADLDLPVPVNLNKRLFLVTGSDPFERTKLAVLLGKKLKQAHDLPVFYWTESDFIDQRHQVWIYQRSALNSGDESATTNYFDHEENFHNFMGSPILIFDHLGSSEGRPPGVVDEVIRIIWDRIFVSELPTVIVGSLERIQRAYDRNELLARLISEACTLEAA